MQTGAIEAVKQEKAVPEKGGRNYELDFFRLVFALLVFIYHTNPFIGKNTRVVLPPDRSTAPTPCLLSSAFLEEYSTPSIVFTLKGF